MIPARVRRLPARSEDSRSTGQRPTRWPAALSGGRPGPGVRSPRPWPACSGAARTRGSWQRAVQGRTSAEWPAVDPPEPPHRKPSQAIHRRGIDDVGRHNDGLRPSCPAIALHLRKRFLATRGQNQRGPWAANTSAVARPIPLDAPVISTTASRNDLRLVTRPPGSPANEINHLPTGATVTPRAHPATAGMTPPRRPVRRDVSAVSPSGGRVAARHDF